jgi:hypothetical protein
MRSSKASFAAVTVCMLLFIATALPGFDDPVKSGRHAKKVWTNDDFPESQAVPVPQLTKPAPAPSTPRVAARDKAPESSPATAKPGESPEVLRTRIAACDESAKIIASRLQSETSAFRIETDTRMLEQLSGLSERYKQTLRELEKPAPPIPAGR